MTDIFRSALSYFAPTGAREENDFVGQIVELGPLRLHVKRVIAEGKKMLFSLPFLLDFNNFPSF